MLHIVQAVLEPCVGVANAGIVVGRSTEGVELGSVAIGKHGVVAIHQLLYSASLEVECGVEVAAPDLYALGILGVVDVAVGGCCRCERLVGGCGSLDKKLLLHLCKSLLSPRHILALKELYLYEVLAMGVELGVVVVDGILLSLPRTEDVLCTEQALALLHTLAVLPKRPYYVVSAQRFKVVLVENLYPSLGHVNRLDTHILVDLLHLEVLCLWR